MKIIDLNLVDSKNTMIIDFKNKLEKLKQNTIDSERFVERLKSKTGTKNRIKLASLQKVIIFL